MQLNSILFPGPPKGIPDYMRDAARNFEIFIPRNRLEEKKEECKNQIQIQSQPISQVGDKKIEQE